MNAVFDAVYSLLRWLSRLSGMSYEAVNIIAYYLFVPLIFLFLVDRIIKRNVCVPSFLLLWGVLIFLIPSFDDFSDDVFERSVQFLDALSTFGMNYTVASVVVCILLPVLLFVTLLRFAFPGLFQRQASFSSRSKS